MEKIGRQKGDAGAFLPTIQKGSVQARQQAVAAAHGSLQPPSQRAPSTQDASQKEMAALQRNYESMSSIVQLCQRELAQV